MQYTAFSTFTVGSKVIYEYSYGHTRLVPGPSVVHHSFSDGHDIFEAFN